MLSGRLFTVPYFLVRSSGSSANRYGRPSWFFMYRGGRRRGFIAVGVGRRKMAARTAKCSMSTILQKNTQSRCRAIRCGQSKHQAFLKEGWGGKRNETRKPFQIPSQLTPKDDLKHPCVHRASKHWSDGCSNMANTLRHFALSTGSIGKCWMSSLLHVQYWPSIIQPATSGSRHRTFLIVFLQSQQRNA